MSGAQATLVGLVCFVYAWWSWSMAAAARDARAGLLSLAELSVGWGVLVNGLLLVFCLPPCASAAYESWRAAHASERPLGRGAWTLPAVALVAVIALLALEAQLTSL